MIKKQIKKEILMEVARSLALQWLEGYKCCCGVMPPEEEDLTQEQWAKKNKKTFIGAAQELIDKTQDLLAEKHNPRM